MLEEVQEYTEGGAITDDRTLVVMKVQVSAPASPRVVRAAWRAVDPVHTTPGFSYRGSRCLRRRSVEEVAEASGNPRPYL